ncbi:component of high affinity nitrate transporter [Striga asiatica]|uniref:Component of high affinity nitrate transporter n=1 Tax=Striga asiatica TaxID=4170 RepID=A0A5A7RI22_STRAF|nr:component of high affinity nitrate transporter [Striga asiatica]
MAVQGFLVAAVVVTACLAANCGSTTFSSLPATLIVSASTKQGQDFLVAAVVVTACLAANCGGTTFSSLPATLFVSASTQHRQVLKAGEDNITITWSLDLSLPSKTDSAYKTLKIKLCFAPISQQDRGWRKTEDDLRKDKSCQHNVITKLYNRANNNFTWTVGKDVPSATYFIRAYVLDSSGKEVAYGQTTDDQKKSNLFEIRAISGRHVSVDVASACYSGFAVFSLVWFFYLEKKKANNRASQQN